MNIKKLLSLILLSLGISMFGDYTHVFAQNVSPEQSEDEDDDDDNEEEKVEEKGNKRKRDIDSEEEFGDVTPKNNTVLSTDKEKLLISPNKIKKVEETPSKILGKGLENLNFEESTVKRELFTQEIIEDFFIFEKQNKETFNDLTGLREDEEEKKQGKLFILNGTCSAGKSTIIKALKSKLSKKEWKFIALDDIDEREFSYDEFKELEQTFTPVLSDDEKEEEDYEEEDDDDEGVNPEHLDRWKELRLADKICDFLDKGYNVVCDTVLLSKIEYDAFVKLMGNISVTSILVYCPFLQLAERIDNRNQTAMKENATEEEQLAGNRGYEQIIDIFPCLYVPTIDANESIGSLVLDDVVTVLNKYKEVNKRDDLFKRKLSAYKIDFGFSDDRNKVLLKPKFTHDFIVNSTNKDHIEEILEFVQN